MGEPGPDRRTVLVVDQVASSGPPLTLRDETDGDEVLLRRLFETGRGASLLSCGLPPALRWTT